MTSYQRFAEKHPGLDDTSVYSRDLRKTYALEAIADAAQAIDSKLSAFIDAMQIMAWRNHPTDAEAEREAEEMGQ